MLIKIAWRNIWRSRGRSLVVLSSIVVGIWALITMVGLMNGFLVGYMAEVINHDISNVQIHHPEFAKDRDVKFMIPNGQDKTKELEKVKGVNAVTTRVLVGGMVASPKKASGVQIKGVIPASEATVTGLDSLIGEGKYFDGIRRNPILIGKKLAETLDVGVRSKVVLTFTDLNQDITSAAFRVAGIVHSSSVNLNERSVMVRQTDLQRLLGVEGIHEIAMLTDPQADDQMIASVYQTEHPEDLAETWREIAPELALMQDMYGSMLYVLIVIVMTALVFGILNTMLMAVLERYKELGMLMAVGMAKLKVFLMVLLETLFLGVLGSPLGLFLGWATISYFTAYGIDLSAYSEGLESFGYSSLLKPYIDFNSYFSIAVAVIVTAFIGAIYPAYKAIKLKPVEALQKI